MLPGVSVINEYITSFEEQLTQLVAEADDQLKVDDVIEACRVFVQLRQIKDRLEEVTSTFGKFYQEVKDLRIPEKFEAAGVPTVNLDEGYRVTVSHNVRASIRGGMRETAHQWLKDNGLGDIVTETVNASTLSALARSMVEDNKELDASLFNVAIMPNTSVTKTK